jgi:hypothetical protein
MLAVLGIRDILVRIRIRIPGSVLWLMDPDPTPDPTPFFIDFEDAKKKFPYFFLITYSQAHRLQSKEFNFLLKFLVKMLPVFCRHYFNPLNTFMRKGKDPDPEPYI